jgi:aryl-alcohol dehydrogenase-like predicted oxidoreductase
MYSLGVSEEITGKARYLGASSMAAWKFAKALSLSERNGWARFVTM